MQTISTPNSRDQDEAIVGIVEKAEEVQPSFYDIAKLNSEALEEMFTTKARD